MADALALVFEQDEQLARNRTVSSILSDLFREEEIPTSIYTIFPRFPSGKIDEYCVSKTQLPKGIKYDLSALSNKKYLKPEMVVHLSRFKKELALGGHNCVLGFGSNVSWALLGNSRINDVRGATAMSTLVPDLKVVMTHHPFSIFRNPAYFPICAVDVAKALEESKQKKMLPFEYSIFVPETLQDLLEIEYNVMNAEECAFDIETRLYSIVTCVGFAIGQIAYVIPFVKEHGENYWGTIAEEMEAWKVVKNILASPVRKVGQNGLYDIQFLLKQMGIPTMNYCDDTMLAHHALQPELPRSLGFLGSIYTNAPSWKKMNSFKDKFIENREED